MKNSAMRWTKDQTALLLIRVDFCNINMSLSKLNACIYLIYRCKTKQSRNLNYCINIYIYAFTSKNIQKLYYSSYNGWLQKIYACFSPAIMDTRLALQTLVKVPSSPTARMVFICASPQASLNCFISSYRAEKVMKKDVNQVLKPVMKPKHQKHIMGQMCMEQNRSQLMGHDSKTGRKTILMLKIIPQFHELLVL